MTSQTEYERTPSEPAVKPMRSCRWCRGTERESPDGCSHCEDVVWEGDDE